MQRSGRWLCSQSPSVLAQSRQRSPPASVSPSPSRPGVSDVGKCGLISAAGPRELLQPESEAGNPQAPFPLPCLQQRLRREKASGSYIHHNS